MIIDATTITCAEAKLQPAPRYHLYICDQWICSTIADSLPAEWKKYYSDKGFNMFIEVLRF